MDGTFSKGSFVGACLLLCKFELCVIESMSKLFILLSSYWFLKLCYGERDMKGTKIEFLK